MSNVKSVDLLRALREVFDLLDMIEDPQTRASYLVAMKAELQDLARASYAKCCYDLMESDTGTEKSAELLDVTRRTVTHWAQWWAQHNGLPNPTSTRTRQRTELADAITFVGNPNRRRYL